MRLKEWLKQGISCKDTELMEETRKRNMVPFLSALGKAAVLIKRSGQDMPLGLEKETSPNN